MTNQFEQPNTANTTPEKNEIAVEFAPKTSKDIEVQTAPANEPEAKMSELEGLINIEQISPAIKQKVAELSKDVESGAVKGLKAVERFKQIWLDFETEKRSAIEESATSK